MRSLTIANLQHTLNVLLVEDNVLDARLISGLLKGPAESFACHHVIRLEDALALLGREQFDVVLLDLNLEDSIGYRTFSSILPVAFGAAILVLSGSDDEDLAIRTVREGAQDYLVKGSFDARLLLRSIRYAVERKRSEEAVRQSQARVRAIFESSSEGIIIADDKGICIDANSAAAELTGISREQLLDANILQLADKEKDFEVEWRRFRSLRNARARVVLRRKDGAKRLVDCGFNADIRPGQHLLMLRDITEQQSLEEQLRQSQKMEAVGRLAGGVAHEFNNILGIISGYAELMQLSAADERQKQRTEKILEATGRASSLTQQLLAFGRRQVMLPKLLNLSAVLTEMSGMIHCLADLRIKVEIRNTPGLAMIHADHAQIEQVVLNLANNARDAMPNGGVLTIAVQNQTVPSTTPELPAGDYVLLSVRDTGMGMDPETQSHIFEPFFTTKKSGSGLGLSTVYGIVKQSGGHIVVCSEPGFGSIFKVYLPISGGALSNHSEDAKENNNQASDTILLVDDEDDLRDATAEYLESCGYDVLKAHDGEEAIALANEFPGEISVVVSDVVMPVMNGREVVDHILKKRPKAKALLISGYTGDAVARQGIPIDSNSFLQKPFSLQVLGSKLKNILEART